MSKPQFPSTEEFATSLSFLKGILRAEQIKLLGGEPLLNKDICAYMQIAKESGVFRRIRVTTNGIQLPKVSSEFWSLADVVEISLYPAAKSLLTESVLEELNKTAASHHTKLRVKPITHFRLAIRETRNTDIDSVNETFASCAEAHQWPCHLLYRNRLFICSRIPFMHKYLEGKNIGHENYIESDGIIIDGRPGLEMELREYLTATAPRKACSFCHGTTGLLKTHEQSSKGDSTHIEEGEARQRGCYVA